MTSNASPSTPSLTPSTRTTRSATAEKAADALAAWQAENRFMYDNDNYRADVDTIEGPRVICYETVTAASGESTRSPPIPRDGHYSPIFTLIESVAVLLLTDAVRPFFLSPFKVLLRDSAEAKQHFAALHGPGRVINCKLLIAFITTTFPDVVFKETAKKDSLSWGIVNKGNEEGADRNEMFISKALVQVYLDTQAGHRPCVVTDIQYAKVKRYATFLLISTITHELGHCLNKHLFGSQFVTPRLTALVGSEKQGSKWMGEMGQDVEMAIFGCITVLEWSDRASFNKSEWLWHVDKALGWVKAQNSPGKYYILSDGQIDHVLEMAQHRFMSVIRFQGQFDVGGASGKAVRAKSTGDDSNVIEQQDTASEALDAPSLDPNTFDFPGLGLQVTLNPNAFRSATSGDRRF